MNINKKIISVFLAINVVLTLLAGVLPVGAEKKAINVSSTLYGAIEGVTPLLNVDFESQNHGVGTQFYGGMFVGKVEEIAKYGFKNSGVGKEGIKYAVSEMTKTKLIGLNLR